MPLRLISFILFSATLIVGCNGHSATTTNDSNTVHVTLLHMNDVYEITPVEGGKAGGLARVATLRQQLLDKNPNTLTVIGGDFFSPSAMGTAKVDGKRLSGKQMVAVLNTLGLDYATFGNHEFDVKEDQFHARMEESKFNWISANVFDAQGKPFEKTTPNTVIHFQNSSGDTFRLGMFGVTINSNPADYVTYTDAQNVAKAQVAALKDNSDFIIGLTHLAISHDEEIAKANDDLKLILGGHEHENYQRWRGNDNTPILKADANARSVYVVELYYNTQTKQTKIEPRLVFIDDTFSDEPAVKAEVDKWQKKVFDAYRAEGLNPEETVTTTDIALDGRASMVRTTSNTLTAVLADSFLHAYGDAQVSLYNSGSIRIDDVIPAGKITVYDIIRILPFGGRVELIEIKGELLTKTLDQGLANRGAGGFLQYANASQKGNTWYIGEQAVSPQATYKVAISDFLMSGNETGLEYLTPDNSQLKVLDSGADKEVRQMVIAEFKRKWGNP